MKTRFLGVFTLLFAAVLTLSSIKINAQSIYEPEGINMPGTWNSWTNSLDTEQMGNFRMRFRAFGGGQYISQLSVNTSEADVVGGAYKMLFTSGPSGSLYQNKWADGALSENIVSPFKLGGNADNELTLSDGFVYTIIFDDNGYADSKASMMKTTNAPVQILSVSGVPTASVTAGEAVGITIELSNIKSPEERFYVLYSTDEYQTTEKIEITEFDGVIGSVNIPGQADGVTLSFFVISTAVDADSWGENRDLFILDWDSNDGANYSIGFGSLASLLIPANNAVGLEKDVSFVWTPIQSAEAYQIQVSAEADAEFSTLLADEVVTDTTFTIPADSLTFNSMYRWRVRKSSETEEKWSNVYHFKTRASIEYVNLNERALVINKGDSVRISGRVYIPEITAGEGLTENLQAWVGISSTNTNPAEWGEESWNDASFKTQSGNDDEFEYYIGKELANGTYFIATRYQYKNDGFVFGGSSANGGGFWDGTTNTNATLTVTQLATALSPAGGVQHLSVHPTFTWKNIPDVSFDVQVTTLSDANFANPVASVTGIQDSVLTLETALEFGHSYRWRVRLGGEIPGPYSESKTFKTRGEVGFFNLQFVENDTLAVSESLSMYAQLYINGYTTLATVATQVSVWIGINTENTDPSTWDESTWNFALLNENSLGNNNDEYSVQTGSDLPVGTYYVAARMAYLDDDYMYGGFSSNGGGFWSETNGNYSFEVIVPTSNETIQKAAQTHLLQNYPNPFNPNTTIPFELESATQVKLFVVDVLGREVATLVNQSMTQGKHSVLFDASRFGSGLYFIRMEAGNQRFVKAMTLIK